MFYLSNVYLDSECMLKKVSYISESERYFFLNFGTYVHFKQRSRENFVTNDCTTVSFVGVKY